MSLQKIAARIKKLALISLVPKSIKFQQFDWKDHNEAAMWTTQMKRKGFRVFAEDSASDTLTLIAAKDKEEAIEELRKAYTTYGISNLQPKLIEYK